jgi:flagellar biosynthesis/type III secretory pathway protein FliH
MLPEIKDEISDILKHHHLDVPGYEDAVVDIAQCLNDEVDAAYNAGYENGWEEGANEKEFELEVQVRELEDELKEAKGELASLQEEIGRGAP